MSAGGRAAGLRERTILASDHELAIAEALDGDAETVDAASDLTFLQDPDDRPVPFTIPRYQAALLDALSGELVGMLFWRPVPHGPTLSGTAWNLGIELVPAARGRRLGTAAARLLARYLFDTTEVDRVQAVVEAVNVPGWRGLELAGFRREGELRGIMVRGGQRRDMLIYGLLRSDLE